MADRQIQKPEFDEWLHWAQVVIDRLTTCVHVYSKPPHADVFMADNLRQEKNSQSLALLRRIHTLIDESDTPSHSLVEVSEHDEQVIDGLRVLMHETLDRLPELSTDMQKLLKSAWHSKCAGRLADELFRGPHGNEAEGIGSGHPPHGRLPEVLYNLLEREQMGDSRAPRQLEGPQRQGDRRSWADKNSFLRSAGRVE